MWKHCYSRLTSSIRIINIKTNEIRNFFHYHTYPFRTSKLKLQKKKDLISLFSFERNICSSLTLSEKIPDLYEYLIQDHGDISEESDKDEFETNYLLPRLKPIFGHKIFVIQPNVKWGPKKKWNTTSHLQLAEAVTLSETVPDWEVVEKVILNCVSLDKKFLFGSGNLKKIKEIINRNPTISAVFISTYMLTALQNKSLEKEFKLPIYDRYMVVLQIFQDHARTKQAKLQIALAEIPYLRSKIREVEEFPEQTGYGRSSKGHISGSGGQSYVEIQYNLLKRREQKILSALNVLKKRRNLLRKNRVTKEFPIIAIVGYTNSGKTSLIKALTGDENLEPKDQMFATLDVTAHAGRLPSLHKVLYIDTIGFISDIPTTLIDSFAATLEDMICADLIVHVRDISHPDHVAQKENVLNTLQNLNLSSHLLNTIIEVGNKVDLLESNNREEGLLHISATRCDGLDILRLMIEEKLIQNTGRLWKIFRVPSGGLEMRWLYKEASVNATMADTTDPNFLLMEVVISQAVLSKFIHNFSNSSINQ